MPEQPRPEGAAQEPCRVSSAGFPCEPTKTIEGTRCRRCGDPIGHADQPVPGPTAEQVDMLVASLRAAGNQRVAAAVVIHAADTLEALRLRLDAAEQERALILAALGEPCAECGHIDWRSDGASDYYDRVEAAEEKVARLTEERDGALSLWRSATAISDLLGERMKAAEEKVARLTEALTHYANPQHWGVSEDHFRHHVCAWLGPGAERAGMPDGPSLARAALDSAGSPESPIEEEQ